MRDFNFNLFSSTSSSKIEFANVYQQILYGNVCALLTGNIANFTTITRYIDLGADGECLSIADNNL
jgi:hypothetical protein